MLHIRPKRPKDASPHISQAYLEIQNIFGTETVPLVFQYIANYEHYFLFLWDRMKTNIQSENFQSSCKDLASFALEVIRAIYKQPQTVYAFIDSISPLEKNQIALTVDVLDKTNIQLLLLLIDLRESMKSIFIGTSRLTQYTTNVRGENFNEFMGSEVGLVFGDADKKDVSTASTMLAPLFGPHAIVVSHYPEFFAHVAMQMEKMQNTEIYLKSRVSMEQITLKYINKFVMPLGVSYLEFLKLTQNKPYINELLYIITDAFPSQFPHLVFTTALMKYVLQLQEGSIVVQ